MSDKLYPARWEPDQGFDEQDILYCHGADYAFWIDPDAEDWWGVELEKAINDAHDLRALVRDLAHELDALNALDPTYGEIDDVLARARALLKEDGAAKLTRVICHCG
jgi:hypothetical protein